jgi:hypothetical protein
VLAATPTSCTDAAEATVVNVQPTLSTTANPSSANTPATLNDSATLSGTSHLLGTGTITFYLFAPGDNCSSLATNIFHQTVNVVAGNNGPYSTTGGPTVSTAGTYHWLAVFSGDANNLTASSTCASEPVVLTNPFQGCTPGFWKNHPLAWDSNDDPVVIALKGILTANSTTTFGYSTSISNFNNQLFFQVFGLFGGPYQKLKSNLTLIGALNLGGGGFQALARHGVAALLSSVSVQYTYKPLQVLAGVQAAFQSGNSNQVSATFPDGILNDLEAANQLSEAACPTNA